MEESMLDTKMTLKIACCMAFALGTAAMAAQQRSTATSGERGDLDEIRKISTLIGTDVMNRANTKVGDLRDLVLSPGGDVLYAVLGYGGVGGIGQTYTAVPFHALEVRHTGDKWGVQLDTTADDLKKAPTIQSENYREFTDPQWVARVHQFFCPRGESNARPEKGTGPAQRELRAVEQVLLATKIRDSRLKNPQNEDLGRIEDLLLDRMHRVAFLIVGRGGALGVGEHYIPVPWSKLGISTKPENAAVTVSVDATKAQLEKAPVLKGDNYATLLAPGFADEVRHYFGVISHGATTGAGRERR
jgi:hypothetical protein